MSKQSRIITTFLAGLIAIAGIGVAVSVAGAEPSDRLTNVRGTIWVANRGAHTIQGFDARTGAVVRTVAMAPSSQPGDLAYARGKLYVAEEFGTPPAIAIVDPETGVVTKRIQMATGSRPHHVHASASGRLVAFGLYGTDMAAVVDTRTDALLGPWDTNTATTNGRVHAGVFSPNSRTLYVASDASNEIIALDPRTGEVLWRLTVPGAHELVVARNGRTAYVTRRTANQVCVLDLKLHASCTDVLGLSLPDTLQISGNGKLLTVGLRSMPAQVAVVDTRTFEYELVRIDPMHPTLDATTIAGHQWTSPNGRFTFAAYEGGSNPGVAVIDHREGNQVVARLSYPGRPHGVDLAPGKDDDDDEDEDEEDED
jgi:DNA-binding beta-propeller fold protein YncE